MKYYFTLVGFISVILINAANCSEEDEKRCLNGLDRLEKTTKVLQKGSNKIDKMHYELDALEEIVLDSSKKLKGQGEEIKSLIDKTDRLRDEEMGEVKKAIDNLTCGGWCYIM